MLLKACLHGSGGPQVGEVTRLSGVTRPSIQSIICPPHLQCTRDQIEMRYYMDKWVTPPKRVTLPTWSHPPPCKKALT